MSLDTNKAANELDASVLKDQFTGTTRAVRRNLLISASLAMLISIDGIKLGNVLGIDLSNMVSFALAKGAITLVVLYELVSFIAYAWIDHASWKIKSKALIHSYALQLIADIKENTRQVSDQLKYIRYKMTSDDDSVIEAIKSQSGVMDRVVNTSVAAIEKYDAEFRALKIRTQAFNAIQWVRIYLLDWAIPLVVGIVALHRNSQQLIGFIHAMFR